MLVPHDLYLVDEEDGAWDGWNNEETRIEHQECEEEALLLSIVVGYEVEGLHVVLITADEEAIEELKAILFETLTDLLTEFIM